MTSRVRLLLPFLWCQSCCSQEFAAIRKATEARISDARAALKRRADDFDWFPPRSRRYIVVHPLLWDELHCFAVAVMSSVSRNT